MITMDIQTALEFAGKLESIRRRAVMFNHDMDRVLEELQGAAENYRRVADYIDQQQSAHNNQKVA